jgi:signal transduction histidine kinase
MIFPLEVTYIVRFILQLSFSLLFFSLAWVSYRSYRQDRGLGSFLTALMFFTVGLNQFVHSTAGPLNIFFDAYQDFWDDYFRGAVNLSLILAVSASVAVLMFRNNVKFAQYFKLLSTSDSRLQEELRLIKEQNEILQRMYQDSRQFVYATAHDLRAPLRSISGFAALIGEDLALPPEPLYVEQIGIAVDKSLALIDGLAYLNKAESEPLPSGKVDLNESVTDVIEIYGQVLADKGVELDVELLPVVWGVESRLRQVFQNLIGNAIKFGANRIGITSKTEVNEYIIGVKDNGIGIDPQYHQKIFETFQRLNAEEHYPGAGIGLAIVRKIIIQHGGRLWVESEPGNGSAFYFTIPHE